MDQPDLETIALRFVECINNQDIESLASLMTEDFTMIAHNDEPEIVRQLMWQRYQSYFPHFPDYRIHIQKMAFSRDEVAMIGKTTGSHVPVEIEREETVIFIARIEDDLVSQWRIYSDMDTIT